MVERTPGCKTAETVTPGVKIFCVVKLAVRGTTSTVAVRGTSIDTVRGTNHLQRNVQYSNATEGVSTKKEKVEAIDNRFSSQLLSAIKIATRYRSVDQDKGQGVTDGDGDRSRRWFQLQVVQVLATGQRML